MALTYYVALPFTRSEDGLAAGEPQECQSESAAIRLSTAVKYQASGAAGF